MVTETSVTFAEARAMWPGMQPDDWYILLVAPTRECDVKSFLEREVIGSEVYYPVMRLKRVEHGVEIDVERAVWGGYVYARFQILPDWERISMFCAARPRLFMRIGADDMPVPMWEKASVITSIQLREKEKQFDPVEEGSPIIESLIGQRVMVPSGLFKGKVGKIMSVYNGIAKLRIRVIGKNTAFLTFPLEDICDNMT